MKNNHGFSNIIIILGVLVVLGLGGYFGYSYFKKVQTPQTSQVALETKPAAQPEIDNSMFLNPTKINSDLNLIGSYAMTVEEVKKGSYLNEKKELFVDYFVPDAAGVAKLVDGKWTSILIWNGYPGCKIFDNAGVPYKKSTIEFQCILDSSGNVRASTNKNDSIELCKFRYGSGPYYESPLEINCKKLMNQITSKENEDTLGTLYQNDKYGYSFYVPTDYQFEKTDSGDITIYKKEYKDAFDKLRKENTGKWVEIGNINIFVSVADSLPENITNADYWLEKIKINNFDVYTGEDLAPLGHDKRYYIKLKNGYLSFYIINYFPKDKDIGKYNQEYNAVIIKMIQSLRIK